MWCKSVLLHVCECRWCAFLDPPTDLVALHARVQLVRALDGGFGGQRVVPAVVTVHVRMYVRVSMCLFMRVSAYVCVSTCVSMCVRAYVCVFECMCAYVCICIMYVCMYVCVCGRVYVCEREFWIWERLYGRDDVRV